VRWDLLEAGVLKAGKALLGVEILQRKTRDLVEIPVTVYKRGWTAWDVLVPMTVYL
jgi:hypothetical protein